MTTDGSFCIPFRGGAVNYTAEDIPVRIKCIFLVLALFSLVPLVLIAQPPAEGEWLDLPAQSLLVDPGSPLDFSGLVPPGPAGARGAVTLSGGQLMAGGEPLPPFNCGMVSGGIGMAREFPTHAESDMLAVQLRLHGYSLIRVPNADYLLMRFGRKPLDIHPDQLDRFYYLLAALKRNGLAWMLDVLTSPGKELMGRGYLDGTSPDDLRIRMNFDPAARARWLEYLDAVYARRNPYTGQSILADPALAFVIGANENSIAFAARPGQPYPLGLSEAFSRWARTSRNGLAPAATLPDLSSTERAGGAIEPPADWSSIGRRMILFKDFVASLQLDTYQWMSTKLMQRGFHGPVLAEQVFEHAANNETRSALPIIDMHAYAGEVTRLNKGSKLVLPSSTDDQGLNLWLLNAGQRWLDRPMVMSEYSQPFPNPYRYESGLLIPWLAAFQGYGAICRTVSLSIEPTIPAAGRSASPIVSYAGGLDPTERAAETLSAMLFARGDASLATRTIAVPFGPDQFREPGSAFLSADIRKMALLARFGLIAPNKLETLPVGTNILPFSPPPASIGEKISTRLRAPFSLEQDAMIDSLRANGTLTSDNRTNAARDIYQSSNREMTLDQRAGTICVITPRTEAVSSTGPITSLDLGALHIGSTDAGALVAATSLDGRPINVSRRLLFILAGDSRNTAMALSGSGTERTLEDWGKLPIQMRRVVADLTLRTRARHAKLTVLSLRGAKLGSLSAESEPNERIHFRLDIGAVRTSPTTYFLLDLD